MNDRDRRHRAIETVLASGPVVSQDALAAELQERGIGATQATLSRDLRELGVLKGPGGYVLPAAVAIGSAGGLASGARATHASIGSASVLRVVQRYVRTVRAGVGQVVLKTNPGEAQLVALEMDRFPPIGVIGTLAGDDTVFVAVDEADRVETLAGELTAMTEGIG